jgi:hypothetical protein
MYKKRETFFAPAATVSYATGGINNNSFATGASTGATSTATTTVLKDYGLMRTNAQAEMNTTGINGYPAGGGGVTPGVIGTPSIPFVLDTNDVSVANSATQAANAASLAASRAEALEVAMTQYAAFAAQKAMNTAWQTRNIQTGPSTTGFTSAVVASIGASMTGQTSTLQALGLGSSTSAGSPYSMPYVPLPSGYTSQSAGITSSGAAGLAYINQVPDVHMTMPGLV